MPLVCWKDKKICFLTFLNKLKPKKYPNWQIWGGGSIFMSRFMLRATHFQMVWTDLGFWRWKLVIFSLRFLRTRIIHVVVVVENAISSPICDPAPRWRKWPAGWTSPLNVTHNVWKQLKRETTEKNNSFQPGHKNKRECWFLWMYNFRKLFCFFEDVVCLKMYVGALGVFCTLIFKLECCYDIQCRFLYIWTYQKTYFCKSSKISKNVM